MSKNAKDSALLQNEATGEIHFPKAVKMNQLSYLIFLVARTHRGLAAELLRPSGIYPGQELLLMHLFDQDGQSQAELTAQLGLDASTVTKMVQRLEAEGHISRSRSKTDARAFEVRLTASGQKLKSKVEKMWADLNDATMAELSSGEEAQLKKLLAKVYSGLSNGAN